MKATQVVKYRETQRVAREALALGAAGRGAPDRGGHHHGRSALRNGGFV